ncbi:hypothetical protein RFI_18842, partial [Reticulomyxa filosa]
MKIIYLLNYMAMISNKSPHEHLYPFCCVMLNKCDSQDKFHIISNISKKHLISIVRIFVVVHKKYWKKECKQFKYITNLNNVLPFFLNKTFFWRKKLFIIIKKRIISSCYDKDWVLFTNKAEKLNQLVCYICKQIANNAVELHCDEHENAEQVYLFGEECLQSYLKQSNGKCPIQQHDHCEFVKNKSSRQQISDLLVICPRQYDLKKKQSKEGTILGEKQEQEKQCSYKGKIKEMKDHLDKSCQLISIQQVIALVKELQLQLQTEKLKTDELKETNLKSSTEIQQLNKKIDALQHESVKKDAKIFELTNDIQQVKSEINQTITQLKKQIEQCQSTCDACTKLNVNIFYFKKRFNEVEEMNNDNQILKQQLDNVLIEIKQLKKEMKFKNNQIHHYEEDKKENDSDYQLLQTKSNSFYRLINTFTGHVGGVYSIDYSTFDGQFICSGSDDRTVCVWDVDSNKQIQSFNGHSDS